MRLAGHSEVVEVIEKHYEHRLATEETLPTQRDDNQNTLLHLAVQHHCRQLARALLDQGADPNARNKWGQRPIDLAVYASSGALRPYETRPNGIMIELLIQAGVEIDLWLACVLGENHLVR